jgi:predicted outer membrane repeat protein
VQGSALQLLGTATARVARCVFTNCTESAVKVDERARLECIQSDFRGNMLFVPPRHPGSDEPPVMVWEMMGGALSARGQARLRVWGCVFEGNGGEHCLAGGAVSLGTRHRSPRPAHASFVRCLFAHNSVGDCGGGAALFNASCANFTRCRFLNNSAFGWCRGGGGIYTQALSASEGGGISWISSSEFIGNRCPDAMGDLGGGGAISQVGILPDAEIDMDATPDENDWKPEYPVAGTALDVRDTTFDGNWPGVYQLASEIRKIRHGVSRALGEQGNLSGAVPNAIDPAINTTVPWELHETLREAQDEFWREEYPPDGLVPEDYVGKPFRLSKHWDDEEPDPDTGLFPGQGSLPRLSDLKNQSALQTLLRLERDFGPGAPQTQLWLAKHVDESLARHVDREFEPGNRWPEPPEPTESELEWCCEPLDELHNWAFDDVCEYYERSRNWENWTESEAGKFWNWAAEQQREYDARELAALDVYAKRRGYMGCKNPVRRQDLSANDTTTPWVEFLSEDDDPERNPQWPWNQAPSEEQLWRWGGPMRDLNRSQIKALTAKGKDRLRLPPPHIKRHLQHAAGQGDEDDDDDDNDA